MLIDTHCHINIMVKKQFDMPLTNEEISLAKNIVDEALAHNVSHIINVGTSLVESKNCIELAQRYKTVYAVVGIHPTDCTADWQNDIAELAALVKEKEYNRIVGIGETGLDRYHPGYNMQRQKDAFKAQIELSLESDLGLVVHTRQAPDETLGVLEEYAGQITKGIIHCFSEDSSFVQQVIDWGFALGIGGTLTYPKNLYLRDIVSTVSLNDIVLETDAPFLPPQIIRGKQNHPLYIATIAEYIAQLRHETIQEVAEKTTTRAKQIFNIV